MSLEDVVQMSGSGDQSQDGNGAQQTAPQPAVTINLPGAGKAAATRPRAPAQPRAQAPSPVARLFPSAGEKVVVRKERENGEHGIVGVYTHRELSTFAVIEEFLQRVVLPKYGPGRYHCTMLDVNGNQTRYETFPVEAPVATQDAGDTGLIGLLRDVTLRQQKSAQQAELDALLSQLRGVPAPAPGAQPVPGGPDLRAIESRIEELSRRGSAGTSDMDRRLIEKVIDRLEEIERRDRERSMAPAPMPMPMPTPGPSADDIARAVADTVDRVLARMPQQPMVDPNAAADKAFDRMERMMQMLKPPPEPPRPIEDPVDKLVKQLDFLERMKGGRVESLEKKIDDMMNRPPPGAIEELEQMSRVFETVEQLGARRLGRSSGQGFGEYVSDVFRSLPQTIREASTLVDKVRQKDAQQLAMVERVAKSRQAAAQARAQASKPAPKPAQSAAGSGAGSAGNGSAARAAYPREFGPYLTALQSAGDDESRVKATLSAFQALGKNEPWKAYWVRTVTLMRNRDPQAVEFVDALCANLVNNGWLGIDQRDAIKTAFEMQFAAVCDRLFGAAPAASPPDQVPVPDGDSDSGAAEAATDV